MSTIHVSSAPVTFAVHLLIRIRLLTQQIADMESQGEDLRQRQQPRSGPNPLQDTVTPVDNPLSSTPPIPSNPVRNRKTSRITAITLTIFNLAQMNMAIGHIRSTCHLRNWEKAMPLLIALTIGRHAFEVLNLYLGTRSDGKEIRQICGGFLRPDQLSLLRVHIRNLASASSDAWDSCGRHCRRKGSNVMVCHAKCARGCSSISQ